MTPRTLRRLAWSAFAATAACAVVHGALVLSGSAGMVTAEEGLSAFPIITLGCVLGALVGAMVAVRHPRNPIGWLLLVGQLGVGIGLVAAAFAVRVLEDADLGPLLAGRTATVVGSVLGAGWALTIMTAVFLLFPDGSLPSGRWRAVLWALPVPQVVVVLTTVVLVPLDSITAVGADFDRLSPTVAVVRAVASALSVGFLLLGIAALVLRLRRATGERRQQLRWLTTAAAALVAGFALAVLVGLGGVGGTQVWGVAPLFLAYAGVPVAAGVAILRYRLYDIDVVLNRAVVGAVVVAFVTVGYVVVVVLVGALLGGQDADRYWPSLVATALVALAFQPLRRGVARLGERAVHGRRAAPYQALADLSHRLARAVSLDQILPGVAEAAGRSLGAGHVTVRLEVPKADDRTVHWPPGPGVPTRAEQTVPVRHDGSRLGEITVSMPAGRQLTKDDRTLLDDLASHAGLGMHNAQLAMRLRAEVARTVAQADELAASRRRLLAAQESQRQLLRRAIGTDVLPHLAGLRPVLAQQATDGSLAAAAVMISRALEALRDLARGVFPPILAHRGLGAALGRYAGRTDGRVRLTVAAPLRTARFASHVEAVLYFCVVETVREFAGSARVELDLDDGCLLLAVSAVDRGSRPTSSDGVVDRVLACGGTVTTSGPTSTEAGLRIRMPAPAHAPASAHTAASWSGPNAAFDT